MVKEIKKEKIDKPKDVMVEKPKKDNESEVDFLNKLLTFQHEGGWGKQLDKMIINRVKILNNWDAAHIEKGCVVNSKI